MEQRLRDTTNTQVRSSRRPLAEKTSFSTETKKVTDQKNVTSPGKESEKVNICENKACILCSRDHCLDKCRIFLAKPLNERKQYAFENHLCFGCLSAGHQAKFCKQRLVCTKCSKQHATSFHGDYPGANRPDLSYQEQRTKVKDSQTAISMMSERTEDNGDGKCSMIVPVWLSAKGGNEERLVYALLDSQSDTTFILDKTCDALGLDGPEVQLNLSTMTDENRLVSSRRIKDLKVRGHNGSVTIQLPVTYTRSIMPANLSHVPTPEKAKQWEHLAEIADDLLPFSDIEVGLLIGYNCPKAIMPREVIAPVHDDEPYAERTDLGWGIVGIVKYTEDDRNDPIGTSHRIISYEVPAQLLTSCEVRPTGNPKSVHFSVSTTIKENILPKDVGKMFELDFSENAGDQKISYDDRKFMKIMTAGIHKTDEHYEMPLPFRDKEPSLPNNRSLAAHRLRRLQSQFKNNSQYREDYSAFMNNIIQSGHAEKVPESELQLDNGHVWYIPHHGVYHPKKPGKIRVVFDCSSKCDGISLNDCLLKGPDLTNDLVGVLCRFRLETVAVMCDIEQMFHQFKVNPEHRNYLRFLWWDDGQIAEYRMTVHLFGAASSPGCANFGLKQTAKDNQQECGETAANFVQQNFYVDDGLSSLPTVEEAIQLIGDSKNMCERGGLRLHKFVSNSKEVMAAIPSSEQSKVMKEIDIFSEPLPMERVLGVQWCIELDTFQFRITMKDSPLTRRGVLSTVSSIYDPLGFLAPFVLRGKLILQQLCKEDSDWDSPLPEYLQSQWDSWKREIILLQSLNISRCVKPPNFGNIKKVELHHFSDGSTYAYGQCSYLRLVNSDDQVHCAFLMGKARVAPTKPMTIPRVELTAAVISVKVSTFLKNELRLREFSEIFWTDSRIVLGYVNNDARRFHVFVANRIQQIRNRTEPEQWRYVATKLNPADDGSRGLHAKDLHSSKWLQGPEFLWEKDIPESDMSTDGETISLHDDPEVKKVKSAHSLATSAQQIQDSLLPRLEYFSDWFRLKRAVANCMKFTNNLKLVTKSGKPVPKSVEIEDLHKAELIIIKHVQNESFNDEICILQGLKMNKEKVKRKETVERKKALKTTSALFRLDPYLDSDGLLRVGGRLKLASMSDAVKHPVILPKRHHITQLIVRDCHEKTQHQGRGLTVNEIRSRGYWVIGCSSTVTNFISKCVLCRRLRGNPQKQKMADLPFDRTEEAPPFTYSAVDLFGPFYVKEGRKELKRYGVLFTCMGCRAIHIETANSLTTDSFICALRRFLAFRGPVRQLRCDRGTNFVGALNEFEESKSQIDHTSVKNFLLKQNCDNVEFKMNPPMASHMGGVWERQIRSVRSVLASLLHQASSQLDDESFRTLMAEVMSIVNSRPLTSDILNDVTSPEALTPNHLLTMKSKVLFPPPGVFQQADVYSKKRWRRVQHLSNQFWFRWRREYLQSLQVRQKWVRPFRDLREGDVVILKDENMSRNNWKLARVTQSVRSADDHVRTVKLAVADCNLDKSGKRLSQVTYLERPIHKTVLLVENE